MKILGTGSYLPEKLMTNADFEKIIDTSDEWITTRTGIKERHYADGMTNAQMCEIAAKIALEEAGVAVEDLGAIIVGSVTNEKIVPFMAGFYIIGAIIIVIMHADMVGPAFAAIFKSAFTLKAAGGGVGGYVIMQAITWVYIFVLDVQQFL